jgi:hypothetical protein
MFMGLTILSIISGYADPEYVATGNISEKADVYGFGIVLFEIISGRLIRSYMKAEGTQKLPPLAYVRFFFLKKNKRHVYNFILICSTVL